jgi:hypothetical protein
MMKFLVTMVVPSKSGALVHQVILQHDSESLDDFYEEVTECDFVMGEEIYRDNQTGRHYPAGTIILNTTWMAKIKILHPQSS